MRRFYLAVDCGTSKPSSLHDLLSLLANPSHHKIVVACSSRVSMDAAVSCSLASSFMTVALIDGSDDRDLSLNLAAARSKESGVVLLVTDAALDSLPQDNLSLDDGDGPLVLINYDISRSRDLDAQRIEMVFGSSTGKGVIVDLFSSNEEEQFRAIESYHGQDIHPLPMTLNEIL